MHVKRNIDDLMAQANVPVSAEHKALAEYRRIADDVGLHSAQRMQIKTKSQRISASVKLIRTLLRYLMLLLFFHHVRWQTF
jgi:hypothetical protein